MSILGKITENDTAAGRGKPLPNAKWRGTVESAQIGADGNGTRLIAQVGSITTPDGSNEYMNGSGEPYRIGNRKVFLREWTDHSSQQAAEIGQRRIKQLLVATGLVAKPTAGQSVEDSFSSFEELAEALVGKSFLFTSKQVRRKTRIDGALVDAFEVDGVTPKVDVEISTFHAP